MLLLFFVVVPVVVVDIAIVIVSYKESLAYKKAAVSSSQYSSKYNAGNLVDMNHASTSITSWENAPWMRIDLGEIYFVHEVLVWCRQRCCYQRSQHNLHVRAGKHTIFDFTT